MTKAEYAREYRQARRETARLVISGKRKIRQEYIKVFSRIARVIRENKHKPFLEEQIRGAFPKRELFDFLVQFIMEGRGKAVKLHTDINKRYVLEALQKVPGHGLSAEKIGKMFDRIAEKHRRGSESFISPPVSPPAVPRLNAKTHRHTTIPNGHRGPCRGHYTHVKRNAKSRTYQGQSSGELHTFTFRQPYSLSKSVWGAVGDTEDKIMDVVWGGISQGRDVRSVATDLMAYLKGGPEIVKGRWGKLEPGTKEYAKRLGSKGVDYRAMRLYRSEIHRNQQEAAVTEGEDNPACTGEYDWILMPGRRVFLCECPKLAEEGPYTKDTIPDYPHPNCLLAGTMILMADGTKKPIEQIAIDDMVITADGNAHKVISIMQTKRHKYFHIFVKGNQIKATDEHPFIKADIKGDETGWIEAKDIHDGDILVIAPDYPRFGINSLRGIKVESVIEVECAIPFIVYNFEVETRHNYIANDFVTHNCDCMVEPRVKDGDDLINELRAYMKGEPEGNDIALWAQEQGLADDGTVGMMVPGGAEGEPGHRGDMAQIQEDIKQLVGMESVNLNGVDKDLAEGIYDGYKTVLDRYPILRGQFNLLGINENRPNHAASTNPVTGEINVNLDTFGLSKYVIGKIYNKKVKDAYFPQGTSWKSIIIHEIGHRIDGYLTKLILGRNWDKGNYTNNISYTLRNNILKNLNISDIKRNLSEYAEFSEPDFLAEAFSEFMSSNDPRPIAKMAGGFIDYYLKE